VEREYSVFFKKYDHGESGTKNQEPGARNQD